jgi:hypothetical protein
MHWGTQTQVPPEHLDPGLHTPQTLLHPSDPHCLPAHSGMQVQTPAMHCFLPEHVPHDPPHPSPPQSWPVQSGKQGQVPSSLHGMLPLQVPQPPPQPSGPHWRPSHWGQHCPASLHSSTHDSSQAGSGHPNVPQQYQNWSQIAASHWQPPQPGSGDGKQPFDCCAGAGRADARTAAASARIRAIRKGDLPREW